MTSSKKVVLITEDDETWVFYLIDGVHRVEITRVTHDSSGWSGMEDVRVAIESLCFELGIPYYEN